MLGHNNPMSIENWCDKMEFQGRGAAHILGVAWCNLEKVSQVLDMKCTSPDSEDELEDASEDDDNNSDKDMHCDLYDDAENSNVGPRSDLERAFDKLRMNETLKKDEEDALVAFADKFVTCTLNPDMAAKMISATTSPSCGIEIVRKAKETQTHHHTKTCKKN